MVDIVPSDITCTENADNLHWANNAVLFAGYDRNVAYVPVPFTGSKSAAV